MVAGYSTAESVLMGSESFTLLYPTLVNKGVVLPMSGYGVGMPRNLDHILLSRFHCLGSTHFLDIPCAEACQRLWRRSQGGRWTATWNWGGLADKDEEEDYDEEKELDWGSFEWKIGHDCVNPCCGWKNRIPLELCRYKSWHK